MIQVLRPYPSYSETGSTWTGSVPSHWEVRRLKYLLRERDARSADGSEQLLSVSQYTGVSQRRGVNGSERPDTRATSLVGYKQVEVGDLVVNIMLAWNGSLGVSRHFGIASPAYGVYRFRDSANPWYFHYLLRSPDYLARIKAMSTGVVDSRLRLYTGDLYRLDVLVPPVEEQAAIVRFLDYVDRRIHRYLVAKHKVLAILDEQIDAVVTQAVTRGLDATVRRRSTDVDWLRDVPDHWDVRLLKAACSMRSGEGITSGSIEPSGDFPVYGGNGVRGYTSRFTHQGDYALVGRQGALCGNVHLARGRFWASEHAIVAKPKAGIDVEWLAALLRAMDLNQYSMAAAQPGLAVERILRLRVPIPPRVEQEKIADHIRRATRTLQRAIDSVRREVALVREYRTRMIADVVTGKLDAREAVTRLPAVDVAEALEELVDAALPDNAPVGSDELAEVEA